MVRPAHEKAYGSITVAEGLPEGFPPLPTDEMVADPAELGKLDERQVIKTFDKLLEKSR